MHTTPSTRPQKLSKSHQLSLLRNMARSKELRAYRAGGYTGNHKDIWSWSLSMLFLCCCPVSEDLVFSPGPSRELLWASRNFQNIGSTHRSISNNRCYSSVNILRKQKNVDRNFHSWTLGLLFFFPPSSVVPWFLMVFQKVLTFSSDCNQDQQCWRF